MGFSYNPTEFMLITAAQEIEDGDVVVTGQGFPTVAAILAKEFFTPNAILLTEAGMVDYTPVSSPIHIADPTALKSYSYSCDILDIFSVILNRGFVDVSFLGVGQVDKYGNLNSSILGDYAKPRMIMAGAGGAPEFLSYSRKVILTMRSGKFVEKLDYLCSSGFITGGKAREESGHFHIPGGPAALISTKGLFRFDKDTHEMYLAAIMPGVTVQDVQQDIPWKLKISPDLTELLPPTDDQKKFIRRFDPPSALGRRVLMKIMEMNQASRK
ncbi:CoA-transferase subunit beta [Desulfosporosinus metallidurans]|uniref:3-oxoadipate CoA-transferase subunit B n=1 Tax=Desulfosporosinus metallidurans TaxID=1888891 RepID=A0A1Q8QHY1_9FIRM|nr:CoA-transferase [Desulfosporosinus metallidurans]OLN26960.1 3-oxoadipate CoA-transferase subunit B [Desulfosporosinus metallidurans]